MEGKANIQIGQVNNLEKQKITVGYYVSGCDTIEEAQSIKYAMDKVAVEYGCDVHDDTCIIDESTDQTAKKKADKKVEKVLN